MEVAFVVISRRAVVNVSNIVESVKIVEKLDGAREVVDLVVDDTEVVDIVVDVTDVIFTALQSSLTSNSQLQEPILASNLSPGGQLYLHSLSPEHRKYPRQADGGSGNKPSPAQEKSSASGIIASI